MYFYYLSCPFQKTGSCSMARPSSITFTSARESMQSPILQGASGEAQWGKCCPSDLRDWAAFTVGLGDRAVVLLWPAYNCFAYGHVVHAPVPEPSSSFIQYVIRENT